MLEITKMICRYHQTVTMFTEDSRQFRCSFDKNKLRTFSYLFVSYINKEQFFLNLFLSSYEIFKCCKNLHFYLLGNNKINYNKYF